jgi:hypothetical protein
METMSQATSAVEEELDEDDETQNTLQESRHQTIKGRKKILPKREKRKLIQRRGSFVHSAPIKSPKTIVQEEDSTKADHLRFPPLDENIRVGFSILNLVIILSSIYLFHYVSFS